MARRVQSALGVVAQRDRRAEGHRREEFARSLGIGLRVERERGIVLAGSDAVGVCRLLLLESAAVAQQDLDQRRALGCAPHPTTKAVAHQPREVAAVVDVGMGDHHIVDGRGIDREGAPVPEPIGLQALEETTVDQGPPPAGVDEEPAAGHRAGCAEELERRRHLAAGHRPDRRVSGRSRSVPNVPITPRRGRRRSGSCHRASPGPTAAGIRRSRHR